MRVGLVSDSHGLFEPRLRELFAGCDLILHAGDAVRRSVLDELARIAPVRAVRGNNDVAPELEHLPILAALELGGVPAVLVHQIGSRGRLHPPVRRAVARHRARLLVYGHSHRPAAVVEDGLLFVNPGSAGPRRFSLPTTAGVLRVGAGRIQVRLVDLASPELRELFPPLAVDLCATVAPTPPGGSRS